MSVGTTCATVLTRAIFAEGCKSVAAGMNAMDLRRGITMAVDAVVTNLKSRTRMISTSEEIAQVSVSYEMLNSCHHALTILPCAHNVSFTRIKLSVCRHLCQKVGTISANGEREIGELIAKAMEKVGKEGVITIAVSTCTLNHGFRILEYSRIYLLFSCFPT